MRDFVTPQMFGAAADGVNDDTAAVRTAFEVAGRETALSGFRPESIAWMNWTCLPS